MPVVQSTKLPVFRYDIKNQTNDSVDIHIDGDIVDAATQEIYKNWFGDETSTSFKSFRQSVETNPSKVYNVYINSGGGSLTEALAMHDFLVKLQSEGKVVNTFGMGIIASAATYILMAGTNTMTKNSWMMIHNVSGRVSGTVDEVEQYAATMRKFNDSARNFYSQYTGIRKEDITKMMNSETWMTADEAKDKGFVKNVSPEATFSNTIKPENWLFENNTILNSYNSFTQNSSSMETKLMDAITNGFNSLLEKLGLSNKAGDDSVKNALAEFTTGITNALSAQAVPDEAAMQALVNTAVTEAFKNIGTNAAFTNAISEATKNQLTKTDLDTAITNLTTNLAAKLGGATSTEDPANKDTKQKVVNKKYAGVDYGA